MTFDDTYSKEKTHERASESARRSRLGNGPHYMMRGAPRTLFLLVDAGPNEGEVPEAEEEEEEEGTGNSGRGTGTRGSSA